MNRFQWLIKRELWESRALWVAPLVCLGIVVGGTIVGAAFRDTVEFGVNGTKFAAHMGEASTRLDSYAAALLASVCVPFFIMLVFTQFFYSIDALYGERRERAILFWKSLPISDAETVGAKLFTAAIVMPAFVTAAAFAAQVAMCVIVALKFSGVAGLQPHLWSPAVWFDVLTFDLYVFLTGALWALPVIAFNLLISAAVPKAPFGYAVLGPAALMLAELITFRTGHLARFAFERYFGLGGQIVHSEAFQGYNLSVEHGAADMPHALLGALDPIGFLTSPALIGGLVAAAALAAGAIWVRRYRDASY